MNCYSSKNDVPSCTEISFNFHSLFELWIYKGCVETPGIYRDDNQFKMFGVCSQTCSV
jgi:hypothetical protein